MSVLVFTENWEGKFKKLSFEIVSYGRKIAESMNTSTTVLSIGNVSDEQLGHISQYGADKILTVPGDQYNSLENQVYASIIAQAAEKEDATLLVLANNNMGRALAPRISARLKAGLASAVVKLPESIDPFVVTKKVFNGNAFARVKIASDRKIVTLNQNAFGLTETAGEGKTEVFDPQVDDTHFNIEVKDVKKQTGKVLLTDAEIVVSGGRGMKGPENWGTIEQLAEMLGGATACSRPVSDEGWRPHEEHTGQTGKVIAPTLYFAVGISGAIQHVAGVSGSKCIVAINKDPDAPIFEVADYGIVGDALTVMPSLIDSVKKLKSS